MLLGRTGRRSYRSHLEAVRATRKTAEVFDGAPLRRTLVCQSATARKGVEKFDNRGRLSGSFLPSGNCQTAIFNKNQCLADFAALMAWTLLAMFVLASVCEFLDWDVDMDRFSTRRKLLRGSLSAPLVLTVASPSVLANSSFIACTDRNDGLVTTQKYTTTADSVFRVEVDVYQLEARAGDTWTPDTRFERKWNGFAYRYYRIDVADAEGIYRDGRTKTADGKRHKIVWFNKDGNEVGSGWLNPHSGEAVSCSCWASFKGTAA